MGSSIELSSSSSPVVGIGVTFPKFDKVSMYLSFPRPPSIINFFVYFVDKTFKLDTYHIDFISQSILVEMDLKL